MQASAVLAARGLRKVYGDVVALDHADLALAAGEIRGLVGPNGAGKTTLLGMLLGLTRPDGGELVVLGRPVEGGRTPDAVSGFVDTPAMYPSLTARANLGLLAALSGPVRDADVDGALDRVGLLAVAGDRVRGFSLGMRQRLGLAAALLARPRLLVLDEPANGLDPAGTAHVHRVLHELQDEGTAVLLSSHRMDELAALCDTITVLHQGRVAFDGRLEELAATAGAREHRLVADDAARALELAGRNPGVQVSASPRPGELLVLAATPALDALVSGLVRDGVAVRELTPVRSALEVAFLRLTSAGSGNAATEGTPAPEAALVGVRA